MIDSSIGPDELRTLIANVTSSWRSSSTRTAIMSNFRSLRTWVLMNLSSFSSSSLNLFNPCITKRASLPISFFPLQSGPLGLPSWYSRLNPHVDFNESISNAGAWGIAGNERSEMGVLHRNLRNMEVKAGPFHLENALRAIGASIAEKPLFSFSSWDGSPSSSEALGAQGLSAQALLFTLFSHTHTHI